MNNIVINKDLCIGCGACAACCPDTFEVGDDFIAEVINDDITEEVKEAAENCPTDAIEIKEDSEN